MQHTATHCNTLQHTALEIHIPRKRETRCALEMWHMSNVHQRDGVHQRDVHQRCLSLMYIRGVSLYIRHVSLWYRDVHLWCTSQSLHVLQCVAVCCSVLQCVAVCCSVSHPSQERDMHISISSTCTCLTYISERHVSYTSLWCRETSLTHIFIETNPAPREGFLFTMFPNQDPGGRGLPSSNLY